MFQENGDGDRENDILKFMAQVHLDNVKFGDSQFINGNLSGAIFHYGKALKATRDPTLVRNVLKKRGHTYYKLGLYSKSLSDSEEVLKLNGSSVDKQVINLKIKSLCHLGKYEEASKSLANFDPSFPQGNDLKALVSKMTLESEGQLNILHIFDKRNKKHLTDEIGEYFSDVRVKQIEGKGRGLVAEKDFDKGSVILSARAFAINWGEEDGRNKLVPPILQKILLDEDALLQFSSLSRDSRSLPNHDEDWLFEKLKSSDNISSTVSMDSAILEEIASRIMNNGFSHSNNFTGVWILPAYMNHSCSDHNAYQMVFGDLMVVRALRNIRKGEEITLTYTPAHRPERKDILAQHGISTCSCLLCISEEKIGPKEDEKVLKNIEQLLEKKKPSDYITKATILVESIVPEKGFQERISLSLLSSIIKQVIKELIKREEWKEAAALKGYRRDLMERLGLIEEVVITDAEIFAMFLREGNAEKAETWRGRLKEDLVTAFGSPITTPIRNLEAAKILIKHGVNLDSDFLI